MFSIKSNTKVQEESVGGSSYSSRDDTLLYYEADSGPDDRKDSRDFTLRKIEKTTSSRFFISEQFESLDYNPIANQLERAKQKTETFGSLMLHDFQRTVIFVLAGILTALIVMGMESAIHTIGHWKYVWVTLFVKDNFESSPYEVAAISVTTFVTTVVPIMIGTCTVVYMEPTADAGGVARCIAYLNGIRVPQIFSIKGLAVKVVSTVCVCVSGLAGGKEGPAMNIGATVGGALPSALPWLQFKSDRERRDLAAAGFGAGIAVVFGAPMGGMLLSLEEGVSFWDMGLMWKIYLCCVVCYAVGSVDYSVFLGKTIKINNPELSSLGRISLMVTSYELFELVPFAFVAVFGGFLGALLVKIHTYVTIFRKKFVQSNCRKLTLSFVVSAIVTAIQVGCTRYFRYCSEVTADEIDRIANDTMSRRAHQLYCESGEHSDTAMLFAQTQDELLRTFFGEDNLHFAPLILYCVVYFILLPLTWGVTISYGMFVPQIIFGAAWGRLVGGLIRRQFPDARWAQPAKYAYVAAAAQLSATAGKTFSILMIMLEASGSINFSFPLMLVVIVTKTVGTYFSQSLYHKILLMQGMAFLYTKPPPLSMDVSAAAIMSPDLITLHPMPTLGNVVRVIGTTKHNGFPIVDPANNKLLGLILRQQLLVLLKYKAYKYLPPQTTKEKIECLHVYMKWSRKNLNESEILESVKPQYLEDELELTPYYDAFPTTVSVAAPAVMAYSVFRNLALRHLVVVASNDVPVGMITRKDLAKFHTYANFFKMGVKEMLIKS